MIWYDTSGIDFIDNWNVSETSLGMPEKEPL